MVRRRHKTGVNNLRNNPDRIFRIEEKRPERKTVRQNRRRRQSENTAPLDLSFLFEDDD